MPWTEETSQDLVCVRYLKMSYQVREDGSKWLETEGTGKETMERNNWTSQNLQRVVELRKKKMLGT